MNKVNIKEVAARAGVSKSSVSNFLNERNSKLSENMREKIRTVIEELNYTPYLGARRLSMKSTSRTVGVILENTPIDNFTDMHFFLHLSQYISEELKREQYRFIIIPDQDTASETTLDYVKSLSYGLIDGFLILNIQKNDKYITNFKKMKIPSVCFGYATFPKIHNFVATDHRAGVKNACNYFIQQGIKDIFVSMATRSEVVFDQFFQGYSEAMADAGLPVSDDFILAKSVTEDADLYDDFFNALQKHTGPVAFLIHSFQQYALLRAVKDCRKRIRKDVVYILHDYFPQDKNDNRVAYLRSPVEELGRHATKMLLREINNLISEPAPEIFDLPLIEGQSGILEM